MANRPTTQPTTKTMSVSVSFLLIIVSLLVYSQLQIAVSAATLKCYSGTDNSCSHFTNLYQYCDSDSLTCKDFTEASLGDGASSTTKCTANTAGVNSFRYNGRCRVFLAVGCASDNTNNQVCSTQSEFKAEGGESVCRRKDATTTTYQKAGEACGSNDSEGKARNCGPNLFCNSKRVCEKSARLGEDCSSYRACVTGATCEDSTCVSLYSRAYGDSCTTNNVCMSSFCDPDTKKCGFNFVSDQCLRDYECAQHSPASTCLNTDGVQEKGTCTSNYYPQLHALHKCTAEKCTAAYGEDGYDEECVQKQCNTEFAMYQCARKCVLPPDQRFDASSEYSVDCVEFKATAWSTSKCVIDEQFSGCDAEVFQRLLSASPVVGVSLWTSCIVAVAAMLALFF